MAENTPKNPSLEPKKLNTFGGVFTPSILTILGVIMYLRFGWVVGNVGLVGTLIIVTLSTSITFLTSLSIASIATDTTVKTGGAYYMISRSLGFETGGAVGIPLYIAQTLSVALYILGFAEALVYVLPDLNQTLVALITTVIIGFVAMKSADIAIKTQYIIMAAIAISLLSLIFGKPIDSSIEISEATPLESVNFWIVFAVFFPAVTGIMAGVNLSGDLKNPGKSIPIGTFMAVGVGYLIYMTIPFILFSRADSTTLVSDPLIMQKISFWGGAILLGVWGATLSSALGSILGAPRVLQALARDKVLPPFLKWLGKGGKSDDTPRIGTIFTLIIVLIAVYLGNLNAIAPVLTMFFLATYGVLNISAGIEGFLGNPSFRPTFKVSWLFSLAGAIGCVIAMFLINPIATVIALGFVFLIYFLLQRRQMTSNWGDVRQGIWMALIRAGLLRIKGNEEPKNWYPNLLVLSGAPKKRWYLIKLSSDFVQNRGLMTVATIVPSESMDSDRQQNIEMNIREILEGKNIRSLVRVISAPTVYEGGRRLVEAYGLGRIYPNTIMLGDTLEEAHRPDYCDMVTRFYEAKRNVLILRGQPEEEARKHSRKIVIWSAGIKGNGALMVIMAYLMTRSSDWQNSNIVLKMVSQNQTAAAEAEQNLHSLLKTMRIDAEVDVMANEDGADFFDLLKKHSNDADLVFLGLAKPDENFLDYYNSFFAKTEGLPPTVYVLAGQDVNFSEVLR